MNAGQEASQYSKKQQPCDDPALSTRRQEQQEKPSGNEGNLEQGSPRAEQYLQACRQTGTFPVSSFLFHVNEPIVNLSHYGLGPSRTKALALALQNDNVVTHLELENNDLCEEGAYYLMEMLQINTFIRSLNLSQNKLGPKGATFISKMLENNLKIKSIKLSGNDLDDSAAECLSESLQRNYVIKEVDLSHNKFSEAGGKHLSEMLDKNSSIEVLDLSWNNLRMQGAAALSAALKANSSLKELYLSHNGFGCSEAESLGQALKQNDTLVLLDMSGNSIGDQAVMFLCLGLTINTTLKVLKLYHNTMSHAGALTLLKTVKNNKNSALEEIDMSSVLVREAFVELLAEIHQERPGLNVRFTVLDSVTRNLSAFNIFKKSLKEQDQSITEFFKSLDKEETMKVSTSAFRKAVMEAKVPLDKHQLEWLVRMFDKNFTATINYSQLC